MTSPSFLFLLASTRPHGNSELLAQRAATRLPAGASARWLRLTEHPLPPFADTRHSSGYGAPQGAAKVLRDETVAASDLVIVTPVHWYGLPWTAKHYFDHWSGWMRDPELDFLAALRGHNLWAVVVDADDEGAGAAHPLLEQLRRIADYAKMSWRGALLGHANRPGEIEASAPALAASFFAAPDELDDDALWTAFHERTLTAAQWTHRAHLRVAWMHLERYALDEAQVLLRVGIIRLNATHGLIETAARGYHETLTRVWLALIQDARGAGPHPSSQAFLAAREPARDAPLAHYSRERLMSLTARACFVEPDLAPLPR